MQATAQSINPISPTYGSRFIPNQSKYHHTNDQMEAEQRVIQQAKQDTSKFEWLYTKYYEQIFRFINQRLYDRELALDVTSQVFLNALTNIHKYEYRGVPFGSWLYRIAQREVNKSFTRLSVLRTINNDTELLKVVLDNVEDDLYNNHMPALTEEIRKLPVKDLLLIEMRFFDQLGFKEIANNVGMTEGNCKVKVYRILERMKKKLQMAKMCNGVV